MIRILLFIFSLHLCSFVFAQQDSLARKFQIKGHLENIETGAKIDSVKVDLLDEKDSLLHSIYTLSNGKYSFSSIPINANYKITFSKKGFYSRFILVDLKYVPDTTHSHLQVEADIRLLEKWHEEYCGDDYKIETIPTSKLYYDNKLDDLNWDIRVTEKYKIALNKYLNCIANRQKHLEQEYLRKQREEEIKKKQAEQKKD